MTTAPPPFTTRPTPAPVNTIVDLHHADALRDLDAAVREGGMVALIHKVSQGKDWKDPLFEARAKAALDAGLLLGGYHFGSNSSHGAQQADYFLERLSLALGTVTSDEVLLVLDWETNPDKKSGDMSVANARAFVERVHEVTGRWPVFYSYTHYLRARLPGCDPVLSKCPLWQAQYGERPAKPASPTWERLALWQYTNGGAGPRDQTRYPRSMPGLGGCDRSAFVGTVEQLRAWWMTAGRTPA
jgi:lysozyme